MSDEKPMKIVFVPGCFDNFDGTQEELDEMVAKIKEMVASGEIFENSEPIDFDELEDENPELAQKLVDTINDYERGETDKRKLN